MQSYVYVYVARLLCSSHGYWEGGRSIGNILQLQTSTHKSAKNPCWHCFLVVSLNFDPLNKWVSGTHGGTFLSSLMILSAAGITACTVVQAVVKATSQSNGKGQILTPWGSETPERIFAKSKMAAAATLKNRKSAISLERFDRSSRNLAR